MAEVRLSPELLKFPGTSDGLSAYDESRGSIVLNAADNKEHLGPASESPPRKTARLDGDVDHLASVNRARDGKGKGKAAERAGDQGSQVSKEPVELRLVGTLPPVDEDKLNKLGPLVDRAIRALLARPGTTLQKQRPFPATYEDVYQAMRVIVLYCGGGQETYKTVEKELNETTGNIAEFLSKLHKPSAVDWVEELVKTHAWFDRSVRLLESMLAYLDNTFLAKKRELKHIRQLALECFTTRVFNHASVVLKIKEGIKEWLSQEWTARCPHPKRKVMIDLANILHTHNLFAHLFLDIYVSNEESFYSTESDEKAKEWEESPGQFILHVEARLQEEEERSHTVLQGFRWCWKNIKHVAETALLRDRLVWLRRNIVTAIDEENTPGLARMYKLFASVGGLKTLCEAFKAHVQKRVEDIVKDEANDDKMVDRLLHFKRYIDTALPLAFPEETPEVPVDAEMDVDEEPVAGPSGAAETQSAPPLKANKDFIYAASDAFQSGFRVRRNKPAEMIAKFIDRRMRRGQEETSDEEFEKLLDDVLGLYRFTQDKDVFRTFYHRALAKRLLTQRSASDDFEKAVLKKLKDNHDPEFSMGDHMFRDLALSRDLMDEFHSKPIGQGSAQKLNVMVLQRSFWPFSARTQDDILLPVDMQDDLTKFTTFYKNAHKGHKLDYDHSLGTVQLTARYEKGKKELQVSLYQTVVLLLFNDADVLSYKEIQENTRMADDDLKRTLQSLACARERILRKKPVGRDVNETDVFTYNPHYWHEKAKVRINQIQAKETEEETRKVSETIEGDRRHYLDAAIVRIMKANKTMAHNQLVNATIDAVKNHFKPDAKDIKYRIEQLLEQEYMRRDEESSNTYVYVA